jgi:hypothetical protein
MSLLQNLALPVERSSSVHEHMAIDHVWFQLGGCAHIMVVLFCRRFVVLLPFLLCSL